MFNARPFLRTGSKALPKTTNAKGLNPQTNANGMLAEAQRERDRINSQISDKNFFLRSEAEQDSLQLQLRLVDDVLRVDRSTSALQFHEEFSNWLRGAGTEPDHAVTPWGRTPLTSLPGVADFLDAPVIQKYNVLKKIQKLRLGIVTDIKSAEQYFRYIVRSKENGIDDMLERYSYADMRERERLRLGDELTDRLHESVQRWGALSIKEYKPLDDYYYHWANLEGEQDPMVKKRLRYNIRAREGLLENLLSATHRDKIKELVSDFFAESLQGYDKSSVMYAIKKLRFRLGNVNKLLRQYSNAVQTFRNRNMVTILTGYRNNALNAIAFNENLLKDFNVEIGADTDYYGAPDDISETDIEALLEVGEARDGDVNAKKYHLLEELIRIASLLADRFDSISIAEPDLHHLLPCLPLLVDFFLRVLLRLREMLQSGDYSDSGFEDALGASGEYIDAQPEEQPAQEIMQEFLEMLKDFAWTMDHIDLHLTAEQHLEDSASFIVKLAAAVGITPEDNPNPDPDHVSEFVAMLIDLVDKATNADVHTLEDSLLADLADYIEVLERFNF